VTFIGTLVGAISGDYVPQGYVGDADCAIGLGFGLRQNPDGSFDPGAGNWALAEYYNRHCSRLPGFVQDDLRRAVVNAAWTYRMLSTIKRFGTIGQRATTHDLLEEMIADIRANGFEHPVLVAASHHVPRAVAIADKLGLQLIVPSGLPNGFDPKSAQPWTRNGWLWAIKELPVLIQHRLKGWL